MTASSKWQRLLACFRIAILDLAGYILDVGSLGWVVVVADFACELRAWRVFGRPPAQFLESVNIS